MMNKYISDMKNAVTTYKTAKDQAQQRYNEIKQLYGDEAAEKENSRLQKNLATARSTAEAAIKEAYGEGVYAAEQWGKLDGSKLTDDIKLLDAGLVDVNEFEKLKSRHRDNATMLMALKKFGEKQNATAQQEQAKTGHLSLAEPYNTRDIVTLPDKLDNWKQAKAQALDYLDMVDGRGAYADDWSKTLGKVMIDEGLSHFGEGGSF